jgi:hypothetical protein
MQGLILKPCIGSINRVDCRIQSATNSPLLFILFGNESKNSASISFCNAEEILAKTGF